MNRAIGINAKKYAVTIKKWPVNVKLVRQFDTPENRILGQNRSTYLWMEKNYPDTFRGYINNPEVFDETKMAILEYLKTGIMQPPTGAGLSKIDKYMVQNINTVTVSLAFMIIPLCVLPFL